MNRSRPVSGVSRCDLVLLHGWGFDYRIWDGMATTLQADYQIERPNIPAPVFDCCDESSQGIDGYVMPLAAYFKKPCVLVGWSLGGLVAIRAANRFPDRVRAVVLLASTPCFIKRPDWPSGIEQKQLTGLVGRIQKDAQSALKFFCGLVAQGDPSPRQTMRLLQARVADLPQEILLSGLDILARTDLRADLATLDCPLAMILGSNDKLVQSASIRDIHKLRPDLHHVLIADAGHAPFILKQTETAFLLKEFLNDCIA
ncbi:MAG: alpha/beta fold hydrolase [Gammaproteobacteria bacterium]